MGASTDSVAVIRRRGAERLAEAGIDSAATDADALLQQVLQLNRAELLLATADENQVQQFDVLLERRANREPLQHILGKAYFRHLELEVGPGVFVPRPETETLVDLALAALPHAATAAPTTPLGSIPVSIVDLCTGSGAIALSVAYELSQGLVASDAWLEQPATVYAVELDPDALAWTRRNAAAVSTTLNARTTVNVVAADARTAATEELARLRGQVAVVTCNPPYIPDTAVPRDPEVREYDPAIALYGGPDGLEVVRDIVQTAADLLYPGGVLLIEHGDQQGEGDGALGVPHVVRGHEAFAAIQDHLDLTGRPRVTVATRM